MLESLSVRKIIDKISSGEIGNRLPFKEDLFGNRILLHFYDSLYKGYQLGSLALEGGTKSNSLTKEVLGRFILPEPTKDYPIDYVLKDGQQRLTSIFFCFPNRTSTRK